MTASGVILEHKTTSEDISAGSLWWKRLTLDPQVSVYIDAARASGIDTNEVLFDVIRKPAHRQSKGDLGPEDYRSRVLEAMLSDPERYFQRGTIVRLEEESREAARDFWQTAEQVREATKRGRFPRNPDSCVQYGRTCDYWGVCAGEQSIHDPLLFESANPHEEIGTAHPGRLPLLTQSSSRAFRSCPRRYYYRHVACVRPRVVSEALSTGRLMHRALEAWWNTEGDLDAAVAALGTEGDPWGLARRQAMIAAYHARYTDDIKRWEVVAVEQTFVVGLRNPDTGAMSRTFQVGGKVDVLVRRKEPCQQVA